MKKDQPSGMVEAVLALGPGTLGDHNFATSFRGYQPDEVRRVLALVADRWARAEQRADGLERELDELRSSKRSPVLDESALTAGLGDHAARLIATAREEAVAILEEAERTAAEVARVAESRAERLRQEAESLLARRADEAETLAQGMRASVEAEVRALRDEVRAEAESTVRSARAQGREMVAEAKAVRERMLGDLNRRRRLAELQIDQARTGLHRLNEAYSLVRRSLEEVTAELAAAEPEIRRAAEATSRRPAPATAAAEVRVRPSHRLTGPPGSPPPPPDRAPVPSPSRSGFTPAAGPVPPSKRRDEPAPSIREASSPAAVARGVRVGPGRGEIERPPAPGPPRRRPQSVAEAVPVRTTPARLAEREPSLSGRRTSEQAESARPAPPPAPEPAAAAAPEAPVQEGSRVPHTVSVVGRTTQPVEELFARIRADQGGPSSATGRRKDPAPPEAPQSTQSPLAGDGAENPAEPDDEIALARRDALLDPLETRLCKALKRSLQDEQNEVLDRLRRLRGSSIEPVLPSFDDQVDRIARRAVDGLEAAVWAGAGFAATQSGPPEGRGHDLALDLARGLAEPLRARLSATLEAEDAGDGVMERLGATERISAVYRQWKLQRLKPLVRHHLSVAFNRGAFGATPPGAFLRWVVDDEDDRCPDCDDNALAGAVARGETFPTGQQHPPAHPGCRCLLVPAVP